MRRFLLLTLAALACLAAVQPSPPSARARRCPKGSAALRGGPHHRTACVPRRQLARAGAVPELPAGAGAAERPLETQLVGRTLRGVRRAALRRSLRTVRALAASPALAAAVTGHAATAASRHAIALAAGQPTIEAVPIGSAGAGESGFGVDAWMDAGDHRGFGMGTSGYTTECPARDGSVPTRGSERMRMSVSAPLAHRMTVAGMIDVRATATGTGHVGDDARLRDFDMVADVSVSATATIYGPAGLVHGTPAREEFHLHVVLKGLSLSGPMPDIPGAETRAMSWLGSMDAREGSFRAFLGVFEVIKRLRENLTGAQANWYDREACVRASDDPSSITLSPGQHRQILGVDRLHRRRTSGGDGRAGGGQGRRGRHAGLPSTPTGAPRTTTARRTGRS